MSPRTRAQIYHELKESRRRGEFPDGAPGGPDVVRVMEVQALADSIFGDESKAEAWLNRPNAALSGQVPSDLMKDELGAAVVREALERIAHGIFA